MQPAEAAKQFYEQALAYDEAGDVYNAIKLYRRVIKLEGGWKPPYLRLLAIYKGRHEWKPAYHFAKRSLAIDPADSGIWWDLGIAATALKKWRIARNVWAKFDLPAAAPKAANEIFSLALPYGKYIEMIWVRPICPARAEVISIPRPDAGRYYRDVVLYDRRQLQGHNIAGNRKLPVYEYLGHWKHSHYRTFSCRLYTGEAKDVRVLERLCMEAGFGFENWSNSALNAMPKLRAKKSEFYNLHDRDEAPEAVQWVAIAARREWEVKQLLRQWRLISLKEHGALRKHS